MATYYVVVSDIKQYTVEADTPEEATEAVINQADKDLNIERLKFVIDYVTQKTS
jgi:uncharacterized protein (UPF0212 family)